MELAFNSNLKYNLKKGLFTLFFIFAAAYLTSCGSKKSSPPPPPPSCPNPNHVATPAGCVPAGNVAPPYGYQYFNGNYQYYASKTDFLTQTDTLFPTATYSQFLRDALGVCDRCSTTVGVGVPLNCSSWLKGFNMLMITMSANQSSTHQMSIYSTPAMQQSYYQFAWMFPKVEDFFVSLFTGLPAPSCNPGLFSPYWASYVQYDSYNSGKGFVLYVNNGPLLSRWNLYKFRLYVDQGQVGDQSFGFRLSVTDKDGKSKDLATGTLNRCSYPNCRMF